MQKNRFSGFSWALAIFCLPSALWPLALLISPNFSSHAGLSGSQINLFSTAFWLYPAVLLTIAGVLYKLHQKQPNVAKISLIGAFIAFYAFFGYIYQQSF